MLRILMVVVLVALLVYATTRAIERRGITPSTQPRREPPRMVAPDDDPEFLRDLDRRRRHQDETDT